MVGSKLDACANYHVSPFVFIVTRQLTDRRENVVVDISIPQLPNIPQFHCLLTNRLLAESL